MPEQKTAWSDKEKEQLRNLAPTTAIDEIVEIMNRKSSSIRNMAKRLGLTLIHKSRKIKPNRWTDDDDIKLKTLAPTHTSIDIAKSLNRTEESVRQRAKILEIKLIHNRKDWTDEKLSYLLDNLYKIPLCKISEQIDMSVYRILNKLKELGIKYNANRWTDEEIEILKKLSSVCHYSEISKILNRDKNTIFNKAKELNIPLITTKRTLTDEEVEYIKNKWDTKTVSEIARDLKCSISVISRIAQNLNLSSKTSIQIKWTGEKINELRELAKILTIDELAKTFQTTNSAITTITRKKQIPTIDNRIKWNNEDIEKLKILAKNSTLDEISKLLHKSTYSVKQKAKELGISITKPQQTKYKTWTENDTKQLKILAPTNTSIEIAIILNRTEKEIRAQAKKLNINLINIRRIWTEQEDQELAQLWGHYSIEEIAKKLNRTTYSIKNRISKNLKLGAAIDNNYDGLTIKEICDLFQIDRSTLTITWVAIGLKIENKQISKTKSIMLVTITNLLEFLEQNQNIWDSKVLTPNVFGPEPIWFLEKRKQDLLKSENNIEKINTRKQQLIASKKYFLEQSNSLPNEIKVKEKT